MSAEPFVVTEGRRLADEAAARGVPIRLLGGVAIWLRSSNGGRAALGRDYPDLDLIAHKSGSRDLRTLLEELGYEPERVFNATHGAKRLLYHAPDRSFHVDVFLDDFAMSHRLDLAGRLDVEDVTLPAADLLLTKLQVAELNRKDAADTAMLLLEHDLAEEDGWGKLNVRYVSKLVADDWGLYTTLTDNLAKTRELLPELLPDERQRGVVAGRLGELERRLDAEPKTRAWRMRAKIGRRKRWYELPEEVSR